MVQYGNFKMAIIAIAAMLIANIANAQTEQTVKKNLVGAHFAFGTGDYGFPNSVGGGDYNTKYYYNVGLDYSRVLQPNRWDFCTGFEYTYNSMTIMPNDCAVYMGIGQGSNKEHLTLVTIPAQIKYHIGKIFYLNGGVFFNISSKEYDDEYKDFDNIAMLLGCGLGIGFEYEISKSGLVLSLNPYVRWNGIGGLGSFQSNQVKGFIFLQGGVNLGIAYKF